MYLSELASLTRIVLGDCCPVKLPTEGPGAHLGNKLTIMCTIAGNMRIKPSEATYKLKTLPQPPPSVSCSEGSKADFPAHDALTQQQLSLMKDLLYGRIHKMYPQLAGKITGTLTWYITFDKFH